MFKYTTKKGDVFLSPTSIEESKLVRSMQRASWKSDKLNDIEIPRLRSLSRRFCIDGKPFTPEMLDELHRLFRLLRVQITLDRDRPVNSPRQHGDQVKERRLNIALQEAQKVKRDPNEFIAWLDGDDTDDLNRYVNQKTIDDLIEDINEDNDATRKLLDQYADRIHELETRMEQQEHELTMLRADQAAKTNGKRHSASSSDIACVREPSRGSDVLQKIRDRHRGIIQ